LRAKCGSWREAARDVRSAREFKEAFEEMASINLLSSSFIRESSPSCSFILFLDLESDDGGAIGKKKKNMDGESGPDRHRMVDYYVIDVTNTKKRQTPIKKKEKEIAYCTTTTVLCCKQQMSQNSGLGMANNIHGEHYKHTCSR
jgi:hypothetical protein